MNLFHKLWLSFVLLSQANAQRFLREGFSSSMANDFKNEMKLDENESSAGLSREQSLLSKVEWEIHPVDFSSVKDGKLRRHLRGFFKDPIKLNLKKRAGKYGLVATGTLESGKRVRAYWRQMDGGTKDRIALSQLTEVSYDEAIKSRLSVVEFEIQLPPVGKHSRSLPSVIFTVPFEPGSMNGKSIVPRGAGAVKVLPVGRVDGATPTLPLSSSAHITIPMKAGLVDPGWARGRAIFRKGRPTGLI